MDPELVEKAKIRADELQMNFSEYLCRCVESDVQRRGQPFVVMPVAVESRNTRQKHRS
jgi:hypothetical protein